MWCWTIVKAGFPPAADRGFNSPRSNVSCISCQFTVERALIAAFILMSLPLETFLTLFPLYMLELLWCSAQVRLIVPPKNSSHTNSVAHTPILDSGSLVAWEGIWKQPIPWAESSTGLQVFRSLCKPRFNSSKSLVSLALLSLHVLHSPQNISKCKRRVHSNQVTCNTMTWGRFNFQVVRSFFIQKVKSLAIFSSLSLMQKGTFSTFQSVKCVVSLQNWKFQERASNAATLDGRINESVLSAFPLFPSLSIFCEPKLQITCFGRALFPKDESV